MVSRPGQSTRRIVVALDGPASSGKSSVGAAAAEQLQLRFVDTGLFYRALTALAMLEGVDLEDPAALVPLIDRVSLGEDGAGRFTRVLLDGSDATEEARSPLVDGAVSVVARIPEVRAALLERQRDLAADGGIVLAGRDIGTVVLPDADLKVYLDASVEERAHRRIEERGLDPDSPEADEVREQLRARDAIDAGRDVAPLRAAADAVHVRTDGNAFDETVEIVAAEIASVMMTPRPRTRSRPAPPAEVAPPQIVDEVAPKPKRIRPPKASLEPDVDPRVALDAQPGTGLEQSADDERATEHEAAPEPEPTPEHDAAPESEPTAEPDATPATEADLQPSPEPATPASAATRRSQKRTRATLRRAMDPRVASGSLEKDRVSGAEFGPDSSAEPSSTVSRRSTKRMRATLQRAGEDVTIADSAAVSGDETEAAATSNAPSSAPTRRSEKRARATARRSATLVVPEQDASTHNEADAASEADGATQNEAEAASEATAATRSATEAEAPTEAATSSATEPEPELELGPSTHVTPIAQPASTPTLRAQKRSRATARRAGAPAAATPDVTAPEPLPEPEPPQPVAASRSPRGGADRRGTRPRPDRDPILEAAMNLDNHQSMTVRMVALIARIGARLFADVDVQGLENIPRRGPVILAVNHISNADPVVVGAWITDALKRRRIHWLGKRELFAWPVLGWIAAHGGIHPVDRGSADVEAFRLATKILEKGYVLLVFPEGTRSPTGELQHAKDGVAMLALRTGAKVVPIGVSNTDAVWRKGRALPLPFPRRTVTVRIGTPFRVQDTIPPGTGRREAKSLATTEIMGRIAALLDPRHRGVYAGAIRTDVAPEP